MIRAYAYDKWLKSTLEDTDTIAKGNKIIRRPINCLASKFVFTICYGGVYLTWRCVPNTRMPLANYLEYIFIDVNEIPLLKQTGNPLIDK